MGDLQMGQSGEAHLPPMHEFWFWNGFPEPEEPLEEKMTGRGAGIT